MSEQRINPHQVTKPIQLLAAWLVGLILINGSFLGAAHLITTPDWVPGLLVFAAVINVPVFLGLIFFLQTKFRAELQEDTFYSKHLEKITGGARKSSKDEDEFLSYLKIYENSNNNKIQELSKSINSIESIVSTISNNRDSSIDIKAIFEKLNEAKNTLSEAEIIKNKNITKIALNDLVTNYKEIATDLVKSGYKISETFGSSSHTKTAPKYLTISFTDNINKPALAELYALVKKYGFNRIDFSEGDIGDSDIYIGSYIDDFTDERNSILISGEIESAILNNDISVKELGSLIVINRE
ncbi:hypothetical protein I6E84_12830 [Psychrobacter sp. SCQQ22]|uniref:hypothetical protein n=1 Tax=Psychrobacter sp. SCQQ22 TaxID=2792059 RepID=UPI0018CD72D6|nr:hypothetical protein [Psychrobacter sp. SCQQ22]MBH0087099.1 hypothetical protein [Psychrobacter sp. SCQQ22]